MTYPVKYLHNDMRGAPVLSGTAGTLVSMIDACLLTGFGQVTLTSLVVAGGVATATVSAGDTFEEGAVVLVDGATPAGLNGEQRVLSSTSTTFTFATTAPDGTATGTITAKYAPVGGWEKSFSGTNKAVYRSIDPQANGHYLRVDDAGATVARVRGYESMSDVDTGVAPFPTDAQISDGGYWYKRGSASSSAVRWALHGDARYFGYFAQAGITDVSPDTRPYLAVGFGDAIGDAWGTILVSSGPGFNSAHVDGDLARKNSTAGRGIYAPRSYTGEGTSVHLSHEREIGGGDLSGTGTDFGVAPSPITGEVMTTRVRAFGADAAGSTRLIVPGLRHVCQSNALGVLGVKVSYAVDANTDVVSLPCGGDHIGAPATGAYLIDRRGSLR